jgi:ribosomal-protein-alanine N-acetyltransferase
MQTLHTERLRLEPRRPAHAPAMFPLLQDPTIYTHLDHGPPPSLEHLEGVYTRLEARRSPDGREQWLNWIVFQAVDSAQPLQPLGVVQATVLSGGRAWVAYELAAAHRGHGFAREAVQAMLAELAASFGVQRFLATVEVANERSIHLLRRLGFQEAAPEGITTLTATERLYLR